MARGPCPAGRARPTCCSSSSTTSASPSSAASAPTSTRPPSTGSPPAGCATPTSTPPRCARRPGPACSPAATTTACGMGRIVDLATGLPRLRRPHPARRARCCPAMLTPARLRRLRRGQVAPHARGRGAPRRPARPLAARPGLRALLRLLPRRDAPVRARRWCTTTTTSSRPAAYDDGYHLTEDLVDRADRVHRGPAQRRRRQAVVPLPGDRRVPLAAPVAAGVDRALPRPLRPRAGTRGASDALARQKAEGLLPDAHRAVAAARTGCRRGTTLVRRRAARLRPLHGGVRRASSPTPTTSSAGSSTGSRRLGELDNTRDRGAVRQRRVVGGRARSGRSTTAGSGTRCPARWRRRTSGSTRSAGPRIHNNYPWGWTVAGNTPFRRWKRETHEGGVADPLIVHWPAGIAAARRGARASTSTPSTSLPTLLDADRHRRRPTTVGGRRAAAARRRRASRRRFADAGAPERHTHAVLRDVRVPGALPTTAGRRSPTTRSRSTSPGSTQAPWELYDLRADPSECHDLAADAARAAAASWSTGGGPRPSATRCCPLDNRPVLRAGVRAARPVAPRARYTYWPGRAPVPERVAVNVRGRPHAITAHVTGRRRADAGRGRAGRAGLGARRLVVPPARPTAGSCYVHNLAGLAALPGRGAASAALAAGRPHAGASASTRRRAELLVDGDGGRQRRDPAHDLEPLLAHRRRAHRRLVARLLAGRRGLPRPLRLHRHPPPGRHRRRRRPPSSTPSAEADDIIAMQ